MVKVRIDAWETKEDEQLVSIVLDHIASGGSQLDAFAIVGKQLNRTAHACGYRWNAILRKQNLERFNEAKNLRLANIDTSKGRAKLSGRSMNTVSIDMVQDSLRQIVKTGRGYCLCTMRESCSSCDPSGEVKQMEDGIWKLIGELERMKGATV